MGFLLILPHLSIIWCFHPGCGRPQGPSWHGCFFHALINSLQVQLLQHPSCSQVFFFSYLWQPFFPDWFPTWAFGILSSLLCSSPFLPSEDLFSISQIELSKTANLSTILLKPFKGFLESYSGPWDLTQSTSLYPSTCTSCVSPLDHSQQPHWLFSLALFKIFSWSSVSYHVVVSRSSKPSSSFFSWSLSTYYFLCSHLLSGQFTCIFWVLALISISSKKILQILQYLKISSLCEILFFLSFEDTIVYKLSIYMVFVCAFHHTQGFKKVRSIFHLPLSTHCLSKEMATQYNILAWKILWTEKPGGL